MTFLVEHTTSLGLAAIAWALLILLAGGALFRRWLRHEHEDAEEVERVMESLKADHSHAHEMDIL